MYDRYSHLCANLALSTQIEIIVDEDEIEYNKIHSSRPRAQQLMGIKFLECMNIMLVF